MQENAASKAKEYYLALGEKNMSAIENFLDQNVVFIGPLGVRQGKADVLLATKIFVSQLTHLEIREVFGLENQGVVIYNVMFPEIGMMRSAAWLTFNKGLVTKIELFYDARPLEMMQQTIFKKSTD